MISSQFFVCAILGSVAAVVLFRVITDETDKVLPVVEHPDYHTSSSNSFIYAVSSSGSSLLISMFLLIVSCMLAFNIFVKGSTFSLFGQKAKSAWSGTEDTVKESLRGGQSAKVYTRDREYERQNDGLRQRMAVYPPPYPNGWYKLCNSDELNYEQVKDLTCFGQKLALFRAKKEDGGKAMVLDGYCPHMGANLAVHGQVVDGGCLQCPFHLWQFRGEDGQCTHIPYLTPSSNQKEPCIPKFAKTRAWPTHEYHGIVCVYFDAEWVASGGKTNATEIKKKQQKEKNNKNDKENDKYENKNKEIKEEEEEEEEISFPPYYPPHIEEIDNGSFVYRGRWSTQIRMHIIEFAENSADFQHFQPLHGKMRVPWTEIGIPGITIQHSAGWEPEKAFGNGHIAYFLDRADLIFRGKPIPRASANATITFVGPAGVVYFRFITELGEIVLIQSHLPVEPFMQRTEFMWYADKSIPRFLVWYVVGNWIAQWKQDVDVWENKTYVNKPLLVKGDGPVMQMRRWFSQFYSESSHKVAYGNSGGNPLDW